MPLRMGVFDIGVAAVVLVAVLLPPRETHVVSVYANSPTGRTEADMMSDVAVAQGRLAAQPGSGNAADELARLLEESDQHDQSLRVAGRSAALESPTQWEALWAVAYAHAARIEIREAAEYAESALEACDRPESTCQPHDRVRLTIFAEQIQAGVEALDAGIDPRTDPDLFRKKMEEIHPAVRFRTGGPR